MLPVSSTLEATATQHATPLPPPEPPIMPMSERVETREPRLPLYCP